MMWNGKVMDGFREMLRQEWKPKEMIYVVAGKCTGCRRCAGICRHRVFEMVSVEGRTCAAACRQEHCSRCGKCVAVCPAGAVQMVKKVK